METKIDTQNEIRSFYSIVNTMIKAYCPHMHTICMLREASNKKVEASNHL